ncbi:MAG: helix-turn-helix domain-containing protein [Actinobacteria bacterium]|nr:helix-turn-helix domain-containing protein [Actinomycetota bacterium]
MANIEELHDDTVILIEDMETFRIIDNPLRQRIWHLTRNPRSVGEIAERLGVPPTRLYYHVNMLADAGFLEVVEVRKSGAQLERVYQGRAGTLAPSPEFLESIGDAGKAAHILAGALFDNSRTEVEALLARTFGGEDAFGTLARAVLQLPADDAQRFLDRIEDLAVEMRTASRECDDEGAAIYSFTFAFVPMDPS